MSLYLDCNATAPLEPAVRDLVFRYMAEEYGNAGSRTHEYGTRAKQAVQRAREQVAATVNSQPDEVVFTSGATESNNLALLGLAPFSGPARDYHIVTTEIEHKAVLEPLEQLALRGFEVTRVRPTAGGWVDPDDIAKAVKANTLLVSVMQVNNETGVVQPIDHICERLADHPTYLHIDAAQGFGKLLPPLLNRRIDLISISAHKIYGPKGVGALIARRRKYEKIPLTPLMYGGGQERGLRPGTLPVPLIAGFGLAAELASHHAEARAKTCLAFRQRVLASLEELGPILNGDPERCLPHVVNLSFPGLDSETVMLALKGLISCSNGSACTSSSYRPSHVLQAMGLSEDRVRGALRFSWCHMTPTADWAEAIRRITSLM